MTQSEMTQKKSSLSTPEDKPVPPTKISFDKDSSDVTSIVYMLISIFLTVIITGTAAFFAFQIDGLTNSFFSEVGWDALALSGGFCFTIILSMSIIGKISKVDHYPALPSDEEIQHYFILKESDLRTSSLQYEEILEKEFEYTSSNAEQAMEHRMTIVNFYLLVVGGAGSAVVALLATSTSNRILLEVGAVGLLWIVSIVGWLTTLKLIRMRMAWAESAANMNFIKIFFAYNNFQTDTAKNILKYTLFFNPQSLPRPYKRWNVFHYSVLLVALLDSGAFLGGAMLLSLHLNASGYTIIPIGLLTLLYFMSHSWIYDIALKPKLHRKSKSNSFHPIRKLKREPNI